MASTNETVLLKSTLDISNKPYSVKLTDTEIYWEAISSARASGGPYSEPLVTNPPGCFCLRTMCSTEVAYHAVGTVNVFRAGLHYHKPPINMPWCCGGCRQTESQTVALNEIVAVRVQTPRVKDDGKFQQLEMVALQSTSFSIHVIRRISKHRWRERAVTFHSKDSSVVSQWVEKVQDSINKPEFNRPKHLLVFINPYGGRRRAPKVYHDKVAPVFELAGITTEVITTQRANHARDTLLEYDLSRIDGVVSVGGDGMFSEMMHGLLTRSMRDSGMEHLTPGSLPPRPGLRIGVIPGGSTDTVAWSTNGTNDPITSALHIALGDNVGIDVATVHHGNQFLRYTISMLAYGFYGDCIIDSDRNRWMGPKRYDWAGFKKVLAHRAYEAEVTFLPSSDKDNHPRDGTRCRQGCNVCSSSNGDLNSPAAQNTSPTSKSDAGNTDGWQKVKGRFQAINAFLISCKCGMAPEGPSPCSHLGDGNFDLVLVSECSRPDYVKHLMRTKHRHKDQFDLGCIKTHRVKAFNVRPMVEDIDEGPEVVGDTKADGAQRLRSRVSHNSVWNCDGEVLEEPAIDVRVFRQGLRLFARGVEEEMSEDTSCSICSSR